MVDGNLELLPAGADACRVRLVAAWRQPCAAAGEARPAAFDEMAVCTARTFLDLLAARLYDGATGPRALRRRSNARRR